MYEKELHNAILSRPPNAVIFNLGNNELIKVCDDGKIFWGKKEHNNIFKKSNYSHISHISIKFHDRIITISSIRLIAIAFYGPPKDENMIAYQIDGEWNNRKAENIGWTTKEYKKKHTSLLARFKKYAIDLNHTISVHDIVELENIGFTVKRFRNTNHDKRNLQAVADYIKRTFSYRNV